MDFLVVSGFYSFLTNLVIGLFVYTRNPRSQAHILFAFFSIGVSGWSVGSFLINVIPDKTVALLVLRFNYLFAVWLPSVYIHLVYALTGVVSNTDRFKLKLGYVSSALLSLAVFSPWFIRHLRLIEGTNFYISAPGPVYYFFFAFFSVAMCEVLFHSLKGFRHSYGEQRIRMKYITLANAIAIFAGFEYFSRVFGLFKSPPYDDYILVAYLSVVAYAMKKHRLFDIVEIAQAAYRDKLASVGILAASINHEIRNPLYIIKGVAESHLARFNESLFASPEEALKKSNEVLTEVIGQAQRAMDIIKSISLFAKQRTADEGHFEKLDLREMIDNTLLFVRHELELDRIDLIKEFAPSLPSLHADRRQIEEVLFNLVVNAYQAMKEEGGRIKIEIRTKEESAAGGGQGRKIQIQIIDNGPGIPEDKLSQIFEPFYTTKEDGTGLGLYVTKQLVERNKGKISVRSRPGAGTTFALEFPAAG